MQLKLLLSCLLLVSVYCNSSSRGSGGRLDHRIRSLSDMVRYPEVQESYFRTNKMYNFLYDGQINIGVPDHSDQHSTSRLQADVTLVKRSDEHFILRCRNVRVGKQLSRIHDPQQIQPLDQFEQSDIGSRQLSVVELPVEFSYAEGQIQDLVFQQQEEEWSANLKRGIISMLQIKLQPKDRVSMEEEQSALNKLDTESKTDVAQVYRTNEKMVEGKCDTLYSVNTIQSHDDQSSSTMYVTKTVDLNSCQQKPVLMTNLQFMQSCPGGCSLHLLQDKALQSSTVLRYQIRGKRDKFLVESVHLSNDHVFAPQNKDENSVVVTIRASLRLVDSQEASQQSLEMSDFPQTGQVVSDLLFSNQVQEKYIRFLKLGDQHYSEEFDLQFTGSQLNKVSAFGELMLEMVRHMRGTIDEKASRMFYKAVTLARTLKESELKAVHQQFLTQHKSLQLTAEECEKVRNILPHVYAQAATFNSLRLLTDKIMTGEISPLKASLLMPSVMNCAFVSKEMIYSILRLEQSNFQQSSMLKKAVWLTVGSMMRTACSPTSSSSGSEQFLFTGRSSGGSGSSEESAKLNGLSCSSETEQQFVRIISERLRSSHSWEDKILFLRVLGNAGLESSIQEIERILSSKEGSLQSPAFRLEAVLAMRNMRQSMPQKTKNILLASALNKLESSSVRMAAIQQLMQENPGKLVIDQLISLINQDRDRRVASFTYCLLKSISESKQPSYWEMNKILRAAIKRVKRLSTSMPVSDVLFQSMIDADKKLGGDLFFMPFYDSDEVVPKFVRAGLNQFSRGQSFKDLFALELGNSGLSSFFNDFLETVPERQAGSAQYKFNMRRLADKMLQSGSRSSSQPKSWLSLKLKNQDLFLFTFNEQQLRQLLQSSSSERMALLMSTMRSLSRWFSTEEATMLHETTLCLPTALGSQLKIKTKMPAMFSLHGQMKTEMQGLGKGRLEVQGKLNALVSLVTDISSTTPIFTNGIYLIRTAKASLPLDVSLKLDLAEQDEQLKVEFRHSEGNRDLLKLESRPVIYFKRSQQPWAECEEKTLVADKNTKMESFKQCMQLPMLGLETCFRGLVSKPSCNHGKLLHYFSPWFGPNKVVFSFYPTESDSKQVTFSGSLRRLSSSSSSSGGSLGTGEKDASYRLTLSSGSLRQSLDLEISKNFDSFMPKQVKARYSQSLNGQKNLETCLQMDLQSDTYSTTQLGDQSLGSKKFKLNTKLNWGSRQCQPENYVQAKYETTISPKLYSTQSRGMELFGEQTTSSYMSTRDESTGCKIQIEHNNVSPYFTYYGEKFLDFLVYNYYWNSKVERTDLSQSSSSFSTYSSSLSSPMSSSYGQQGQQCIQVLLNSNGKADIKIQTPRRLVLLENVQVPPSLLYERLGRSNLIRLFSLLFSSHGRASCSIQQNTIHTYDNAVFRMPFSDCYTLLTRDEGLQFTVLAKRSKSDTDKKSFKVITPDHEIKVKWEHGTCNLYLDGSKWQEDTYTDQRVLKISRSGRLINLKLIKQNVELSFNGDLLTILTPEKYHGKQQGMCGNMNADSSDDFGRFHSDQRKSLMQLWQHMTLADGSCQMPADQSEIEFENPTLFDQYNADYDSSSSSFDSSSSSFDSSLSQTRGSDKWESEFSEQRPLSSRNSDSLQSSFSLEIEDVLSEVTPIRQNKIIERNGQRCVSIRPVERCPDHSYVAGGRQFEREVQYTCMSRQDPLFSQIKHQQRLGQFTDLADREVTFSRQELFPRKCVAIV